MLTFLLCFISSLWSQADSVSSCRARVRSVSLESRRGNRSAAERKRPTLGPGRSVTQTPSTCTHSCSHFTPCHQNKTSLLTSNESGILKWLKKCCHGGWDNLSAPQFHLFRRHVDRKQSKVGYYHRGNESVSVSVEQIYFHLTKRIISSHEFDSFWASMWS